VLDDVLIDTSSAFVAKVLLSGAILYLLQGKVFSGRIFPMKQGCRQPYLIRNLDLRLFSGHDVLLRNVEYYFLT
jgi:hypothetical protein